MKNKLIAIGTVVVLVCLLIAPLTLGQTVKIKPETVPVSANETSTFNVKIEGLSNGLKYLSVDLDLPSNIAADLTHLEGGTVTSANGGPLSPLSEDSDISSDGKSVKLVVSELTQGPFTGTEGTVYQVTVKGLTSGQAFGPISLSVNEVKDKDGNDITASVTVQDGTLNITHTLDLDIQGNGEVTVTVDGSEEGTYSSDTQMEISDGTSVDMYSTPSPGWEFDGFSGDTPPFTMDSDKQTTATFTEDTTYPDLVTDFNASNGEDGKSTLTWTNPSNNDLAKVTVRRKTDIYPANHSDGNLVHEITSPTPDSSVSYADTDVTNDTKYYYAVFSKDDADNWNDTVEEGNNADTGKPEPSEEPVNFPDSNLEQAIRDAIDKPSGDIYPSDLEGLTELHAREKSIEDLTGIGYCVDLQRLDLGSNNISNLSPLSGLTNLQCLNLEDNNISDLSPLSDLTNLQSLYLQSTNITDISPLSDLINLQDLELYRNNISDLSPLSELTNLQELNLASNDLSDLSPLSGLTNLQELTLSDNKVSNIGPLKNLTNLQTLVLSLNKLSDISPLSSLISLRYLSLSGNQISNLSPLSNLTDLQSLSLGKSMPGGNNISNIEPLSDLKKLEDLHLDKNDISDLSPLSDLTNLERLSLDQNQISNIQPLVNNEGLGNGDQVYLSWNYLNLSEGSKDMQNIQTLIDRGATVKYEPQKEPQTIIVPDDYSTIQAAVDAANEGDTIEVHSGVYEENLTVDKTLTLKGKDTGEGKPVIDAGGEKNAVTLKASDCTVRGFILKNSGFISGDQTIYGGLKATSSSKGSTITNNTFRENGAGIALKQSAEIHIEDNKFANNSFAGIALFNSSNNTTIKGNTFTNDGLVVSGVGNETNNNTVENNTVNGKPLVYLEDKSGVVVENAGQVVLVNSKNITVKGLDLSNASGSIQLIGTKDSKILNNKLSNNDLAGLVLFHSDNNTVSGNEISDNGWAGIVISLSENNRILKNSVANNGKKETISLPVDAHGIAIVEATGPQNNKIYLNNIYDNKGNAGEVANDENTWNTPSERTYSYNGKSYTSKLGNYWGDYTGSDSDGDGIGDSPYTIDPDKDKFPLMEKFENYTGKGGFETFTDKNKDAGTLKPGESKVTQVVKVADDDKNSDSITIDKVTIDNEGSATGADVSKIKLSNNSGDAERVTVNSFPVDIPTNDLSPFPDDGSGTVDITPTVADNPTDGHTVKTELTVKYTEGGKSFTSSATDGVAETITSDGTDIEITIGDDYSSFGKPAKPPVKLTKAPNGLWSFNLKLSVADTSVAKFTGATISDKFSSSSHVVEVTNDGTQIRVSAGDFGENIGAGATDIHLADLELEIQAKETTTVSVKKVVELLDDGGSSIDATTTDTGEVGFISCPKVKGGKGPPKSHHGKPELLDDVDGNGKTNSFDAFILFKAIAKGGQVVTGKKYSQYFDFDQNESTNSFDAFVLFKKIAKGDFDELRTRKTVDKLKTSRSSLGNSKGVRVIEVKMDEASKGLVGQKLTLNAEDGTIEAIEPGAFDGATVTEGLGSSQATVAACDFKQKVEPGAKDVTLARVRVKGGSSVEIKPGWLDDDSGGSYDLNNVDLNLKQVRLDSMPLQINDISAYPNPVTKQDSVTFRVNGEGITSTKLQVFTSSGRKIYNSGFVTGNSLSWSTENGRGRKVSSGIYLYALTVKGINGRTAETKVKRLLVLR